MAALWQPHVENCLMLKIASLWHQLQVCSVTAKQFKIAALWQALHACVCPPVIFLVTCYCAMQTNYGSLLFGK